MCLYHYRQIPPVPYKNDVSKTGRLRLGQNKKRLSCQIDESCTVLVRTSIFDDKYLELLKQNGWGGGGKKLPNTREDHEKAYNDLIQIMGKKVQCQLLARRAGGAVGSQAEPGCVQDE